MVADERFELGLGTYKNTDPAECAATVEMALDVGYRHVDTAQMYDNEAAVGRGIERAPVDREDVFLATKVHPENLAYEDVLDTTEESLEKLGTDYVDLLYVHWPAKAYDAEETLSALDELHDEGRIEHVGLSNFTPALLDEARDHLDAPVFAHQVEMHPLLQQETLHEYAVEHDHWLVAYSPIARGEVFDVPEIREIADKHGVTPAQVSLAWLVQKENVAAIPKATGAHVRENWEARELELDERDVTTIDGLGGEERLVDPEMAPWN
ncbi:aldo/keto reductase [Halospeciosus flavus]|uniref:Aldo/keto reductase n=1 Tax=Halospeciosus flavus TaxID=3032283 RepID=A0ABD5Z0M1_9EURY|nr:aldo/keto reductase [Halospeciosus flavus]